MKMPYSQYLRIESIAGGIECTPRQFVKACHTRLAPSARGRAKRDVRHAWIRDGLRQLRGARKLARDMQL